jgi:hypothetical protein
MVVELVLNTCNCQRTRTAGDSGLKEKVTLQAVASAEQLPVECLACQEQGWWSHCDVAFADPCDVGF